METATDRHELIFPPDSFNPTPVIIGGVGAGGSHTCLALAKLGIRNITICDPDVVSIPNIGPSIYGRKHVGMKKVDACAEIVYDLSDNIEVIKRDCGVEELGDLTGVVFICVHDMDDRKKILLSQCVPRENEEQKVPRVFEGRMGAHFAMSHSLDPGDEEHVEEWMRFWFSQEEAEPALPGCGATPVSFGPTASTIANVTVIQLSQWFAHKRGLLPELANQVRFDAALLKMEAHYW